MIYYTFIKYKKLRIMKDISDLADILKFRLIRFF
jgi:hypothetical protein